MSLDVKEEVDDADPAEVVAVVEDQEEVAGRDLEGPEEGVEDHLDTAGITSVELHGQLLEQVGSGGQVVLQRREMDKSGGNHFFILLKFLTGVEKMTESQTKAGNHECLNV